MAQFGNYDQGAAPKPREEFDLMPEDFYVLSTTESDVVPNSKGTGTMLKLTHVVIEPRELAGRKVWQNINVQHQTQTTQEIGQRELANLKAAVGIGGTLADTVQLHGKPFGAHLKVEKGGPNPRGGSYPDRNVVFDTFPAADVPARRAGNKPAQVAPVGQVAANAAPAQQSAAPAPAPAADNTPPWMKKAA